MPLEQRFQYGWAQLAHKLRFILVKRPDRTQGVDDITDWGSSIDEINSAGLAGASPAVERILLASVAHRRPPPSLSLIAALSASLRTTLTLTFRCVQCTHPTFMMHLAVKPCLPYTWHLVLPTNHMVSRERRGI